MSKYQIIFAVVLAIAGFSLTSIGTRKSVNMQGNCQVAATSFFITDAFKEKIGWPLTIKSRTYSLSDCDKSLNLQHLNWQFNPFALLTDVAVWLGASFAVVFGLGTALRSFKHV